MFYASTTFYNEYLSTQSNSIRFKTQTTCKKVLTSTQMLLCLHDTYILAENKNHNSILLLDLILFIFYGYFLQNPLNWICLNVRFLVIGFCGHFRKFNTNWAQNAETCYEPSLSRASFSRQRQRGRLRTSNKQDKSVKVQSLLGGNKVEQNKGNDTFGWCHWKEGGQDRPPWEVMSEQRHKGGEGRSHKGWQGEVSSR